MKCLFVCLSLMLFSASAQAAGVIKFSTSGTDANAGSNLILNSGNNGSLFIWISTDPGQVLNGIDLTFSTDNASTWNPTAVNVPNNGRWLNAQGTLNPLRAQAAALIPFAGTGLTTTGQTDFTLFSSIDFVAVNEGVANIGMGVGQNGISQTGVGLVSNQFSLGTGTIAVTAVPEPGSMACLSIAALGGMGYRLKRRRKLATAN